MDDLRNGPIDFSRFAPQVLALASMLLGAVLVYVIQSFGFKWAVYLFLCPFALVAFYYIKSVCFKVGTLFFFLIFIEKVVLSQRQPVSFVTIGITLIFLIVTLWSIYRPNVFEGMGAGAAYAWVLFFLAPLIAVLSSQLKGYGLLSEQLVFFQVYYLEFFLFFVLGCLLCKRPSDLNNVFFILMALGGLVAVLHIISLMTGFNLEAIRGAEEVASHRDLSNVKNWRYGGVFGNPNTMSAYYVMVAPAGIVALAETNGLFRKAFIGLCMTLMALSLLFAGSRGGFIFGTVNLIFAFCLLRVSLKDALFILLGLLCFVLFASYLTEIYFSNFYELAIGRFHERGLELGVRRDIWGASLQILKENPFGIGLHWSIFANEFSRHSHLYFVNPHNIYLAIALFGGWIGVLAFLALSFIAARNCLLAVMAPASAHHSLLAKLALLFITGFLLFGITEPIFSNGFKLNHIFAFILGVGLSLRGEEVQPMATQVKTGGLL